MSNIAASYYKRKLKLQNLSIYDHATTWTKDQMKTGPNEIGTAVYDWLLEQAKYGATYSDSCGGQNRNKYLAAVCIYVILTTSIKKITHSVSWFILSALVAHQVHME